MNSPRNRRIALVILVLAAALTVFFVSRSGSRSEPVSKGEQELRHQLRPDPYVRMRDSVMDKARADSMERHRRTMLARGIVVTSDGLYCTTSGACMDE